MITRDLVLRSIQYKNKSLANNEVLSIIVKNNPKVDKDTVIKYLDDLWNYDNTIDEVLYKLNGVIDTHTKRKVHPVITPVRIPDKRLKTVISIEEYNLLPKEVKLLYTRRDDIQLFNDNELSKYYFTDKQFADMAPYIRLTKNDFIIINRE